MAQSGTASLMLALPSLEEGIGPPIINVEDLAEQLAQLQQDPEKRQRYAVAGQAFARTLNWDELMPQWLQVIGLVCGVPRVDGESA